MRVLYFSILVTYFASQLCGQTNYPMEFADTLKITPVSWSLTNRPDTFNGDTIFKLRQPQGFVLQQNSEQGTVVRVFLKSKKSYKVFEARNDPNFDSYDHPESYECDTVEFNGNGGKELLIRWSNFANNSGSTGGWSEWTSGFDMWDLDKLNQIFSIQDQDNYNDYWNERIPTENGLATDVVRSSYCQNYNVEITPEQISISYSRDCVETDEETGIVLPQYERTYVYEIQNSLLVLRK
jgi:hypothetical protein